MQWFPILMIILNYVLIVILLINLKIDNGKEFDNQYIKHYCIEYDIKLINISLYHPQTNGSVEVTHKEIQKYS